MKNKGHSVINYMWSFSENFIYSIISLGTCYINFKLIDLLSSFQFILIIILEILVLVAFRKRKLVKYIIGFNSLVLVIFIAQSIGEYVVNLPIS